MRITNERRRKEAWRLRVYVDALKTAEATSDEAWVDQWIRSGDDSPYLPRTVWIQILRNWVSSEATRLLEKDVA